MNGPDELRKLADNLRIKRMEGGYANRIKTAAAAWEAKEREAEANRLEVMRLGKVNDQYQMRLEAAEKLLRWCNGPIKDAQYNLARMAEEIAALAREE